MKVTFKDYLYSSLSILFILTSTVLVIITLKQLIHFRSSIVLSIVLHFGTFFLSYGLLSAFYLRIINGFFPLLRGSYEMDHPQFTLYKLHSVLGHIGKPVLRLFFPEFLRPILYTILGANIGKNAAIGGVIIDPLLVVIGDNVIIGHDAIITSHTMLYNKLFLKPVIIGNRVTIGVRAVIMPGVDISESSIIAPGAVVSMDTKIPPNEFWGGIPARKIRDIDPPPAER
jgi:acetyltransferase-like isoleucine patch superfamily enzyme